MLVSRRLVPVTIPVPTDVRERLESGDSAELIAKIVRVIDETPRR
jgi:hypothetical protein